MQETNHVHILNTTSSPDGTAEQNAGQMWCLMRHIGVMLGDIVSEEDEHWELRLALLECMDVIFPTVVNETYVLH